MEKNIMPLRQLEELKAVFSQGKAPSDEEIRKKFWPLCYWYQDEYIKQGLEIIVAGGFPGVAENIKRVIF